MSNLLLVGITVVAAASFGVILAQLPAPAPSARTVIDAFVLPTRTDRLVFEHRGGLVIPLRDLEVVVELNGDATRYNVGGRLAAADPKWSVVAPSGATKGADDQFRPGDQVWFTDAAIQGKLVQASALSQRLNAALLAVAAVQASDTTAPTLTGARTTSSTTVEATFSEPLSAITSADFTVAGTTVTAARLLGTGSRAELTTTGLGTGATPAVATIATPSGTRDLAGLLLAGSTNVIATDGAPPSVSSVVATSTGSTIVVNFTTSEAATPTIQYGPTLVYGLTVTGSSSTTHSLTLASLTSGTSYHYRISAVDAAGNTQTSEPDRSQSTTGAAGGGGGTGGNYLEFTTAPATLDPGVMSSSITLTLKNNNGNPVNPAAPLNVRLSTNSSFGQFADATGVTITNVTIPTSNSTATVRYIDYRTAGRTVLEAAATATTPATHFIVLTRHGIVPTSGDAVASMQVNVLYSGEQGRDETGILVGVSVLNPTPSARTIDRVSISASPSLGAGTSSFFRSAVAVGAGSDAAFVGCTLTGGDSDTLTCDPADFVMPAYSMRQLVLSFRSSNSGNDAGTTLTATAVLAGGAGSVTSTGVNVRHEGSNGQSAFVRVLAESGAAGNERAGFPSGVTGGSSADFYFEWLHHVSGVRVQSRLTIPAGWRSVSVPDQAGLAQTDVSIQQPTSTQPGYVWFFHDSPGSGSTREIFVRAVPPSGAALDYLRMDSVFDAGSRTPVTSSQSYAVVIA